MVVAAVQTDPIAIPASTTMLGEKLLILQSPRIRRIEITANTNAIIDVENGFATVSMFRTLFPVFRKPPAKAIIERLAPNTAAFDTPSVDGLAMLLFRFVCIIRPETASPAPAISAARTRGSLMFHIILLFAAVLFLARALTPSATDMREDPTNRHTNAMSTTRTKRMNAVSLFLLESEITGRTTCCPKGHSEI